MYESFYGLTEKPFTLLPDPDYLYLSPKHQRALTLLEYGMMNQAGFSVICGGTGAGKTTLIRRLLAGLGDDTKVGLITNTHQSFGELLNWVLMAFGLDSENKSKAQMHHIFIDFLIEQYADNKRTVLIVDEAQNMSADTLEELRMLSNINADKDQVLQVILAGQPALRDTLRKPELMQFAQRIAVDYYLEALSEKETQEYIHHRLGVAGADKEIFNEEACNAIFKYSGGIPRLINLLCDTTMVYGFAEQTDVIYAQLVHDVVREQHSNSIVPTFNTGNDSPPVIEPVSSSQVEAKASEVEATKIEAQKVEAKVEIEAAPKEIKVKETQLDEKVAEEADVEKVPVSMSAQATATVQMPAESSIPTEISTPTESSMAVEASIKEAEESISRPQKKPSTDNHKATDASNVTPIKTSASDEADVTKDKVEVAREPVENNDRADSQGGNDDDVKPSDVAPYMTRDSSQEEDVYPIVHIEEGPKKLNLVIVGLVGGMFVASLMMMIAAWIMFGAKEQPSSVGAEQKYSVDVQREAEIRELKALQKERDAALAVTKALERERDAAIITAKAQEDIRAAELRATEILAEQERKAEKRLKKAESRAREAEKAETRARNRERKARLATEKREDELAAERLRVRERLNRIEKQNLADRVALEEARIRVNNQQSIDIPAKSKKPTKKESFSANPCNSPSAKFLSTCKK